ncbi:hypothetical protein SAMN05444412_11144 [Rhodonellum ikkaensis]|uniref:Lipoprotein n=1 Tax=Rhodonellum ikkaensis TaxID=336829 RepID=A0A1H3SBS9_9BACT|nr:hypothetical protein SAMN05444412_11144 [Rhodonellum ikkaensis]
MKYIFLIFFFFTSCITLHKKHLAVNRYFIINSIDGNYVNVYSPSTKEALNHMNFTIYFPSDVSVGDTLIVINSNKLIKK